MESILLVLLAFWLGFFAAIPIGPSQIEMAKRAIKGHLRAAQMVVLGSVSSDIMYGAIALFGIAPFLEIPKVLAAFHVAGALILWVLTYLTWRESRKPHDVDLENSSLKSKRWAYVTGFSVAMSNPPMILSWLVGVTLAKRLGLATPLSDTAKVLFIAGGALGLGGYLSTLGVVMYRIKHMIPLRAMGSIYRWLAITLFLLSWIFVYGAARFIIHGR
jgi:threonine/homoserine/homoserine lactone efflux protein